MTSGDKILFYAAGREGPESHHIVGKGDVVGSLIESQVLPNLGEDWLGAVPPTTLFVPIGNAELFPDPVPVKPLLDRLTFVRDELHWGLYFRGGVIKITASDYATLSNFSRVSA